MWDFARKPPEKYDHIIELKQNIENSHDEVVKPSIKCKGIEYNGHTGPADSILLLGQHPKIGKIWHFPYISVYC